jgi:hypothetical protein
VLLRKTSRKTVEHADGVSTEGSVPLAERAREPQPEEAHTTVLGGKEKRSRLPQVGRPRRARRLLASAALGLGSILPVACSVADPPKDDPKEDPAPNPRGDEGVSTTADSVATTTTTTAPPPPPPPPVDPAVSMFTNVQKTWSEPAPGMRHLSIVADGQRVEIAEIDLASGLYDVRTTRPEERGQTVSQFAANVGATVAVNADFFEFGSFQPYGLAVGDGVHWPGTADNPDWLFFACNGANSCIADRQAANTPLDPSWTDVVGGAGAALVVDGQPQIRGDHPHAVDRHPRTAIGISDRGKLILMVAAGRSGDAIGMTYDEMAVLMHEMGAKDAINLDGGGSSAMVIHGQRVSQLPAGSGERVTSNHVAVVPR